MTQARTAREGAVPRFHADAQAFTTGRVQQPSKCCVVVQLCSQLAGLGCQRPILGRLALQEGRITPPPRALVGIVLEIGR